MSSEAQTQIAAAAVDEAHDLATTGAAIDQIIPILLLAKKALAGEEITKADRDSVTAQLAAKVAKLPVN